MPFNSATNPWQINESDDEDKINNLYDRRISLPPKPPTVKALTRCSEPRTADWSPTIEEEGKKKKFGRRKTAPSFERAPSQHLPIFSGPPSLKTSSNSLLEPNQHPKTIDTYAPKTPSTSPSSSTFDPFAVIQDSLIRFIYRSIPAEYSSFIHCYLRRDKGGLQKGFCPTYYLHAENPSDGRKVFILAARKLAKLNHHSEYLIKTNIETLSEKLAGDGFAGKLRANGVTNTEYILYDNGKSPSKYGYKPSHCKHGLRRELAGIFYNTNILGLKGPRAINAIIPQVEHDIQPAQGEDTLVDRWRNIQFTDVIQLRNRSPDFNGETKAHMLRFNSNLEIQPSVKNFQMVMETENQKEEVVMQFGRIGNDVFVCDFRSPLSAIQAFCIALSAFDSGIARE